jgi:hypothetical protein
VLQSEGVTIILDGKTAIEHGVTSSSFDSMPDVPFTAFETNLPEGPHSALGANAGLCSTRTVTEHKLVTRRVHGHTVHVRKTVTRAVAPYLSMPTMMTARDGAKIAQTTKVAVSGCPPDRRAHKTGTRRRTAK